MEKLCNLVTQRIRLLKSRQTCVTAILALVLMVASSCRIFCAIYFLISVIACTDLLPVVDEDFLDTVYFTVGTLLTVGYGDIKPEAPAAKIFVTVYLLVGVILFSILVGIVGSRNLKQHMATMSKESDSPILLQFGAINVQTDKEEDRMLTSEDDSRANPSYIIIAKAVGPAILIMSISGFILSSLEGWNAIDTLYFVVTSGTALGYGDVVPENAQGKIACIFLLPALVGTTAYMVGKIASILIQRELRTAEAEAIAGRDTALRLVSLSKTEPITESVFMANVLISMNRIDSNMVKKIRTHFRQLDRLKKGYLDQYELRTWANRLEIASTGTASEGSAEAGCFPRKRTSITRVRKRSSDKIKQIQRASSTTDRRGSPPGSPSSPLSPSIRLRMANQELTNQELSNDWSDAV